MLLGRAMIPAHGRRPGDGIAAGSRRSFSNRSPRAVQRSNAARVLPAEESIDRPRGASVSELSAGPASSSERASERASDISVFPSNLAALRAILKQFYTSPECRKWLESGKDGGASGEGEPWR